MIDNRRCTNSHGIAGLSHRQFCHSTDIARLQLRDLDLFLTSENIDLADFLLSIFIYIINRSVSL